MYTWAPLLNMNTNTVRHDMTPFVSHSTHARNTRGLPFLLPTHTHTCKSLSANEEKKIVGKFIQTKTKCAGQSTLSHPLSPFYVSQQLSLFWHSPPPAPPFFFFSSSLSFLASLSVGLGFVAKMTSLCRICLAFRDFYTGSAL